MAAAIKPTLDQPKALLLFVALGPVHLSAVETAPPPLRTMPCGSAFRVRRHAAPATDEPPLSCVRGSKGGIDDMPDDALAAREDKIKLRAAAAAAKGVDMSPYGSVVGDNNGGKAAAAVTAAGAVSAGRVPNSRFFWLQVLEPEPGWCLDTAIDAGDRVGDVPGGAGVSASGITFTTTAPARQHGPPGRTAAAVAGTEGSDVGSGSGRGGGRGGGAAVRAVAGEVLCRAGPLTEAGRWVYRVVCADGALVRSGLELTSDLRYVLGLHALVEIAERRVNDQVRALPQNTAHKQQREAPLSGEMSGWKMRALFYRSRARGGGHFKGVACRA